MAVHDLVIRGATVVDGLGSDPIRADVAVRDGRIAGIGEIGKDASETVDAGGLALMPGIIDLHTHYDAQVTWAGAASLTRLCLSPLTIKTTDHCGRSYCGNPRAGNRDFGRDAHRRVPPVHQCKEVHDYD